jgi:hypothetical protein
MDQGIETAARGIFQRAKAIILTPKEEWPKIAAEPGTQRDILMRYALPLAAIGPVAGFIGGQVFGYGAFGFSYKPGLVAGLATAVVGFVFALISLFVVSLIADWLAPKFGGEANKLNAFKLVAYGYTASWVVGIFGLIPSLGFFGLLGIYLLYTGANPLMKVPQERSAGYTAVTILCAVVLAIVAAPITAALTGAFGLGAMSVASSSDAGGKITLPGGGEIDTGKMEDMAKQLEGAANGKVTPVDTARMMQLLPAAIGPYQRTASETVGMGAIGSTAEGTYTAGDKAITLKIVDMSAMGAIAGIGAAMGVQRSREDADGYERTTTVDDQIRNESWSKSGSRGKYSVVVGNRFMIEAEGQAGSIDELKAAVAAIDQDSLMGLAG